MIFVIMRAAIMIAIASSFLGMPRHAEFHEAKPPTINDFYNQWSSISEKFK